MAYTPELNDASAATLRRLAWAVGKPMTQTMNAIFMKLPSMCDKQKIWVLLGLTGFPTPNSRNGQGLNPLVHW